MSRKRQSFTHDEYEAFLEQMRRKIEERNLSIVAAAKVLGITRQSLHLHLRRDGNDGTIDPNQKPRHQLRWRTVGRAVRAWEMVICVQGKIFDKDAFGPEFNLSDASVQLLLLPEAIERIGNTNLEVSVLRREASSLVLQVLVKFAG